MGLLAAGALLLGGCAGGRAGAPAAPLAGRWGSTLSSVFVELELRTGKGTVAGRATLMPHGARVGYAVAGTVRGAEVAATLRPTAEGGSVTLRGTLRGDTLTVRLDGGGFADRRVPLVRT